MKRVDLGARPNFRAYAAALRRDARDVQEGTSRDFRPEHEREAGPDEYQDPPVRDVYEESLTGRLTPALKLKRLGRWKDK